MEFGFRAYMGQVRNERKILVENPQGKRLISKTKPETEDADETV